MAIDPAQSTVMLELEYADTFRRLQRMFRARGLSAEDAADLAQETALRVLRFLKSPDAIVHHDDLRPLINRTAWNLMIDRIRRRRAVLPLDDSIDIEAGDSDPAEVCGLREKRRIVLQATEELPERQRIAIALSLDGETPSEIAQRLGIERNAADALLHRARKSLAQRLHPLRAELAGLTALAWLKLKSLTTRPEQNSGLSGIATAQLAAAVIAVSMSAGASNVAAPPAAPRVVAAAGIQQPNLVERTQRSAPPTPPQKQTSRVATPPSAARNAVTVNPRSYGLDVNTGVKANEGDDSIGASTWWQPEENRGISGPLLEATSQLACENTCPVLEGKK